MTSEYVTSVIVSLSGVLIAAISQLFLKKSASSKHKSFISEYINLNVIIGYGLMFLSTILALIAYRVIPISLGMVFETTSYLYVFLFDVYIFKKTFCKKEILGLVILIIGIVIFAI